MIEPVRTPRRLTQSGLRALHVSLNSPVVALAALPNGPASAAVALDAEGALVCLRSIRAGRTLFFASKEEVGSAQLALDAAISFAESMGFLLDDDEVSLRGAEAAAQLWEQIGGDPVAPLAGAEVAPVSEPWLDALVHEAVPAVLALSKFRFNVAPDSAAAHVDTRLRSAAAD